jgi:hypothetical protein
MAEENDEMKATLKALIGAMTDQSKQIQKLADATGKSVRDITDGWDEQIKEQDTYLKASKRLNANAETSVKNLKNRIDTIGISADELDIELQNVRNAIAKTTDKDLKAKLMQEKSSLELKNAFVQTTKGITEATGKYIGIGLVGAITSVTNAVKRAAGGADAMDVAAGYMTDQIDIQNQQNQAIGGTMQSVGGALAGAGGKIGMFGVAVSIAGSAVSFLSNQMSELAKSGIQFLLTQTRKMVEGFQVMSAAGALFSDGMQGMIDTALSANMTIEQFSKAIAENKDKLHGLGMTVGDASKRLATTLSGPAGKKLQEGMFALGMSAEEQAGVIASTMKIMAGPEGKLKASNAEVQAQTAEYAKNLKILQSITGEDVKSKQDKIRQENDQFFMKQQLAKMEPKERARFNDMLLNMNETDRRALTERMKYGGVISKDLAVSAALSKGVTNKWEDQYRAVKDGTASAEKGRELQSKYSDQIQQDTLKQKEISIAQSETAVSASKVMSEQLGTAADYSGDVAKKAKEAADAQIAGGGGGGAALMKMNQDFAVQLQTIARNELPHFADQLKATADGINAAVKAAIGQTAAPGMLSIFDKMWGFIKENALTVGALVAGQVLSSKIGGMSWGGGGGSTTSSARYAPGSLAPPTMSGGAGASSPIGGAGAGASGIGNRIGQFAKSGMGRGVGGALVGVGADALSDSLAQAGHTKSAAGVGVLGSAASGAMMGSMFGPIGTAIGGVAGAGYGLYKNWGNITGNTPTPATNASASMGSSATETATNMSNQFNELLASQKSLTEAWPKDTIAAMSDNMKKAADYLEQSVSSSKDMKDLMAKLQRSMA